MYQEENQYEEEDQNGEPASKPFEIANLNRILAIGFVLGIYVLIFLKILVLN